MESTVEPPELSEDFIKSALARAEATRTDDNAEISHIETIGTARSLIEQAEERLKGGSNAKLSELIAGLGLALASGNINEIREKADSLSSTLALSAFGNFDFSNFFGTPTRTVSRTTKKSGARPLEPEQHLASAAQKQILGKIFGGTTFTLDTQLCFVLMPFDPKFQPLYDDHIRPTVLGAKLRCERADDIHGTSLITWDIWEKINRARFLIAELTNQNPNVFYELGLAHALSKDVILTTQSMDFVPFDLKTIRCIVYDFTPRGTQELQEKLAKTISAVMRAG